MVTLGVRWLLVTMVTVVVTGVRSGHVVDVSTCTCTVNNGACVVTETSDRDLETSPFPPEMPSDLRVFVNPENTPPTIDIQIQPPGGASLLTLRGFFIDLSVSGSNQFLQVSVPENPTETPYNITCEAKDVIFGKDLSVSTISLPRPDGNKNPKSRSERVSVPALASMITGNAFLWRPAVTITPKDKSLIVEFIVPEQLNDQIRAFRIKLEAPDGAKETRELSPTGGKVWTEFDLEDESQRSTCYTIRIQKLCYGCRQSSVYCRKVDGACNRPDRISTNGSLTGSCSMMTTTPITLITPAPEEEQTTTGEIFTILPGTPRRADNFVDVPASRKMLEEEEQQSRLWIPVLAGVLTLALIAMIILFTLRAYKKKNTRHETCFKDCLIAREGPYEETPESSTASVEGSREDIKKIDSAALTHRPDEKNKIELDDLKEKLVFIYYSDILPQHTDVVLNLAAYLKSECRCEVIVDEWCQQEMYRHKLQWHLKYFEEADKIIFIHSEDTKSKYDAYIAREATHQSCTRRPKGDTFSLMLNRVIMDNNDPKPADTDKYLMVRFPYTPKECTDYVQAKFCYELPYHLDEFVLHLHGLQRYEKEKTNPNYIPGINSDEYNETETGRRLQRAVQTAWDVVRRNPKWLEEALREHATRVEADVVAAQTPSDDDNSTGSDPLEALGFLPPSSSDNIPSLVAQPVVLRQKRLSPPEATEYYMDKDEDYESRDFYAPSSTDDVSVVMDDFPLSPDDIATSLTPAPVHCPTPVDSLPVSYYNDSLPAEGRNQYSTEDEYSAERPHGLQTVGVDPGEYFDSGFSSNNEATLMQLRQAMFQTDPTAASYWAEGEGPGLGMQEYCFHPPESLSSGCSSSVDESFEQTAHGMPFETTEHPQYLELPAFGRSSV